MNSIGIDYTNDDNLCFQIHYVQASQSSGARFRLSRFVDRKIEAIDLTPEQLHYLIGWTYQSRSFFGQ